MREKLPLPLPKYRDDAGCWLLSISSLFPIAFMFCCNKKKKTEQIKKSKFKYYAAIYYANNWALNTGIIEHCARSNMYTYTSTSYWRWKKHKKRTEFVRIEPATCTTCEIQIQKHKLRNYCALYPNQYYRERKKNEENHTFMALVWVHCITAYICMYYVCVCIVYLEPFSSWTVAVAHYIRVSQFLLKQMISIMFLWLLFFHFIFIIWSCCARTLSIHHQMNLIHIILL